ncbi:amino acid transporter, putative [Entamoeba histolytica KU27]|uniref:Amino acid transporter, putative n=1 Tax=Entamoeba histolytica KU27 TaxID=885311 RepID=M2RUH2_ENTHI|nr:amino acid transporter, putative [Entamoeba histolytica KU27]
MSSSFPNEPSTDHQETAVLVDENEKVDNSETLPPLNSDSSDIEENLKEIEEEQEIVSKSVNVHTISPLQTFGILINYIVGTGVFGLPYAFENAGLGLSLITTLFFYLMSIVTAIWVLENMARSSGVMETYRRSRNAQRPQNEIEYEVYNYTRMSAIFFGKGGKMTSIIILSFFCYGALWAYSSVFSSSVTMILWKYPLSKFGECSIVMGDWDLFGPCHLTYLSGIVLFALIVIPLSLMGVAEQAILQNILTCWRFFCFGVMALTCIIHIIYNSVKGTYEVIPPSKSTLTFFIDIGGFGTLFSSCSVALACHQNLPDVVTPTKPKNHLRRIVVLGITTATILYVIIGFACSFCFGDATRTPVTHNWLGFTGCNGGFGVCDDGSSAKWYGVVVQWVILLFPAINLTSEYPLVCVTLSSNLLQMIPKQWKEKIPKIWLYSSRLVAAVPPLIAGAIKGDLEVIFNFAGIFGFFLLFIIPGVLQIYSKFIIRRKWGSKTYVTSFSGKYSSSYWAWPILIIAIICFSFALVQFVADVIGLSWF